MKYDTEKLKMWIDPEDVEDSAQEQIDATVTHPKLFKHVAIMPDVHMGWGCTVGTVLALKDAVIPASVGVDIGCGMCAMPTGLHVDEVTPEFEKIYGGIARRIPMGFRHRNDNQVQDVHEFVPKPFLEDLVPEFELKYSPNKAVINQLGTLGGGNHFIELQKDKDGMVWIMLHSGSRNIGLKISSLHIKKAAEICTDAPKDMDYLETGTSAAADYLSGMFFAQEFAYFNRQVMMECILKELQYRFPNMKAGNIINIHHNYVAQEEHFGEYVWVHRKGATKATSDALGIIPGSMGTKSYIVRGKDNPDSFKSCSHGAGRVMSRTAARGKFDRKKKIFKTEGRLNVADFEEDMKGVFSHDVDREHLDEAPRVYKDIDVVIANQEDLITVEHELFPIFNMKG